MYLALHAYMPVAVTISPPSVCTGWPSDWNCDCTPYKSAAGLSVLYAFHATLFHVISRLLLQPPMPLQWL
jgi:hypothetical protein